MAGSTRRFTGRIDRPRLFEQVAAARIVVLAAPGGYGKSTLAQWLAAHVEMARVRVPLTGPADPSVLAAAVVRSLRRAGLSDLADAMTGLGAPEALDRLLGSLAQRSHPVLVFIDDVQHVDEAGAQWVGSLADDLPRGCRLVLAGRRVPEVALGRDRSDLVALGAGELAFDHNEVARLLSREPDDVAVHRVVGRTGGWPAAVALSALSEDPAGALGLGGDSAVVLAGLIDDLLGADAAAARRLAALPLLDEPVVEDLAGPGMLTRLIDSGLPMVARGEDWWVLADPVREALAGEPLLPSVAGRVAHHYAARSEVGTAVTWLLEGGYLDELAEVLASRHWTEIEVLGVSALAAVIDLLGAERLSRWPGLYLAAARIGEFRDPGRRRRWIAEGLQACPSEDPVRRGLEAERCRDLLEDGEIEAAIENSRTLLERTPVAELVTRARTLLQLGCALAISSGATAADEADDALGTAATLLRAAGELRYESFARQRQAFLVSFHGGHPDRAAEQMSLALALLPAGSRDRALGLTYYCEIVDFLGRSAEAEALAAEAAEIGRRLGDPQVIGWAGWAGAWICAHRGDVDATHRWLELAERHPGKWLAEYAGGEFLAIAADMLAALGPDTGWRSYLDRFVARNYGPVMEDKMASITSRVEAMYGDPAVAEAILADRDGTAYAVERDRWARRLLRAVAALRRGERELARRLVDEALVEVQRMGVPDLPQRHEALLVSMLAEVWPTAEPGDDRVDPPVRLSLLGGFSARRGAEDVSPAPGHPATLVKLLALRGELAVEQALDVLWPDADLATGRQRLRNLLNRVRSQSGEVVSRRGDVLTLAPSVVVDVAQFEAAAAEALAADEVARPGLARLALRAYAGELLPGDAYEDWAAGPRERLRRRFLALVDLAATASVRDGELDEAVRLLDAAIAVEPFGEERYVMAARALLVQGRRAAARDVVARATAMLDDLGQPPGPALAAVAADVDVARTPTAN